MSTLSMEKLSLCENDNDHTDEHQEVEEQDLIDVTKEVFASLVGIQDNKVLKSDLFQLLEGTRALEVLNVKLDTGIIQFDQDEISFDCSEPQPVETIINIQSSLLSQLVNWLESNSLPVTVLSCRYVQTLLENNQNQYSLPTHISLFRDQRLKFREFEKNTNYWLVHKVLKSFIKGLCRFVGFVLHLASMFLYDEEDIMSRSMDLNFISVTTPQAAIDEINKVIEWISVNKIENCNVLISQLRIVQNLNMFEIDVPNLKLPFLKQHEQEGKGGGGEEEEDTTSSKDNIPTPYLEFCNEALSNIESIKEFEYNTASIPKGVFSQFIQTDMSNQYIPYDVAPVDVSHACTYLSSMFTTIHNFVIQAIKVKTINQLQDYLQYNIRQPSRHFSVFARALFQFFLIRDDKSIFGSPSVDISVLVVDTIENLVGYKTILLHDLGNQVAQLKDAVKTEVMEQHVSYLHELEKAMYNNICLYGINPCRTQQIMSRDLVVWDTLQVGWESFEIEMVRNFQIGDQLNEKNGEPAISVTSFIYFQKMELMFELLMAGIELELYKPFELYLIYWYGELLLRYLLDHLQTRIKSIILSKIDEIEVKIPKKLKKLKNGPKKEMLKLQNKYNNEVVVPKLLHTLNYQDYLVGFYHTIQLFINCYAKYCIVLAKLKLVDFSKGPPNNLTSMEHLYYLRMKPWSTIGVPSFPSYNSYKQALLLTKPEPNNRATLMKCFELLAGIKSNLQMVEKGISSSISYVKRNKIDFVENTLLLNWLDDMSQASKELGNNASELGKILSVYRDDLLLISQNYKLKVGKGKHKYFVGITVEKQ